MDTNAKVEELVKKKALTLKVVGVIKQKEKSKTETITSNVAYTKELTNWIIKHTDESSVVKAQESNKKVSAINGLKFKISSDKEKQSEAIKYIKGLSVSEKAKLSSSMFSNIYGDKYKDELLNLKHEE